MRKDYKLVDTTCATLRQQGVPDEDIAAHYQNFCFKTILLDGETPAERELEHLRECQQTIADSHRRSERKLQEAEESEAFAASIPVWARLQIFGKFIQDVLS